MCRDPYVEILELGLRWACPRLIPRLIPFGLAVALGASVILVGAPGS